MRALISGTKVPMLSQVLFWYLILLINIFTKKRSNVPLIILCSKSYVSDEKRHKAKMSTEIYIVANTII